MIPLYKIKEDYHRLHFCEGKESICIFHKPVPAYSSDFGDLEKVEILGYTDRSAYTEEGAKFTYVVRIKKFLTDPEIREQENENIWLEKAHAKAHIKYREAGIRAR